MSEPPSLSFPLLLPPPNIKGWLKCLNNLKYEKEQREPGFEIPNRSFHHKLSAKYPVNLHLVTEAISTRDKLFFFTFSSPHVDFQCNELS